MTEKILNQLKSNVKELVKFLKDHDLTSANINLSALGDLTVCNVEYSNETECQESFVYFFDNKDFKDEEANNLDNVNPNTPKDTNTNTLENEIATSNISIVDKKISDIDSITKDNNNVSTDKPSDLQNIESVMEMSSVDSPDNRETDSSTLNKDIIEPYVQEKLIPDDTPNINKDSVLGNESQTNQNNKSIVKDNTLTNTSQHNSSDTISSNNARLINFKEENDFQKKTILNILKEHNVLM